MKVFRLECKESGYGPFTSGEECSAHPEWMVSHNPPHIGSKEVQDTFEDWYFTHGYTDPEEYLPERFRFSFNTLELLETCFVGYRSREDLVLKEYNLDLSEASEYCILPDGQVIFSTSIVKNSVII